MTAMQSAGRVALVDTGVKLPRVCRSRIPGFAVCRSSRGICGTTDVGVFADASFDGRRGWPVVGLGKVVMILDLPRQDLPVSAVGRRSGIAVTSQTGEFHSAVFDEVFSGIGSIVCSTRPVARSNVAEQ